MSEDISNPEMMAEGLSEDIPVLGGVIIRAYEDRGMALVVLESSSTTISNTCKDEEIKITNITVREDFYAY